MNHENSTTIKPARLLKRMSAAVAVERATIRRDGTAPMVRLAVEALRGRLTMELEEAPGDGREIQWTQNGVAIPGECGPVLHLAGLTAEDGDVYYAVLRAGEREERSQAVLVVVAPGNPLLNISARGAVAAGKPLIVGFVIGRAGGGVSGGKRYLLRIIGESLRKFGVADAMRRPKAALHRGRVRLRELATSEEQAAVVSEWEPRVGAFAREPGAADVVAVLELAAGAYSLLVTGEADEAGEVLVEVYEIPE